MALQPIQFATNSYTDRSLPVSAQRLLNMYAEPKPPGSKSNLVLYGTPGLTKWGEITEAASGGYIQGMASHKGQLYVVSAGGVWEMSSDASYVNRGYPKTSLGSYVSMVDNGDYLMIVSQPTAQFVSDLLDSTIFPASGSTDFHWTDVTFQDGYHLLTDGGGEAFYVSVSDGGPGGAAPQPSFDTTDFALANAYPDKVVAIQNANRETWVFGENSTQVYYDSGQADFPFTRIPSGVIDVGCATTQCVAAYDGHICWLGDDLRVYRNNGYQAEPITTPAIEKEIQSYSSVVGARAFMYQQEGHVFYVLTIPEIATWVFDLSTGLWHERASSGRNDWRVGTYVYHFGKHLVGDVANGNIYELDLDVYTENGTLITREATSPPLHAGGNYAFMNSAYIDMETGVGLVSGQGSNPQAMLELSDDGGRTWGSEKWTSIGAQGGYLSRAYWRRLGRFRSRSMRLSVSDPVKVTIIDAFVDVEPGSP